jgi:diphthine-ammonia ligase
MGMRVAALCSGGKDSSYALWLAIQRGYEIAHLVAMIPRRDDSLMFHFPNIELIDLFAECTGLHLVKAETSGERGQELVDLKQVLRGLDAEGIVSGAIASNYQKGHIDRICEELGLASLAPLWGREPVELIREMLKAGFDIIITGAAAQGLDSGWLGRKLDEKALRELITLRERYGVNPSGEGGEYESLVLDAPFFKSKIEVLEAEKIWRGISGYYLIKRARLVRK